MQFPNIVHPKRFEVNGMFFEVVSFTELSDEQAAKIAMHYFKIHKFKKKDQGKLFQILTTFDDPSKGMLGAIRYRHQVSTRLFW